MNIDDAYATFANKMTNGEFSKMSNEAKLQYIFDTEEGIFIPEQRKKDYNWLIRNFLIQNKKHLLSNYVMSLLKKIILK